MNEILRLMGELEGAVEEHRGTPEGDLLKQSLKAITRLKKKVTSLENKKKKDKPLTKSRNECFKKKAYNERTADQVIAKRLQESGVQLRKYYCGICFRWHVTGTKEK